MRERWIVLLALGMMLALVVVGTTLASPDGQYGISWWTVDSGGNTLNTGGDYSLGGTVGQPDAGVLEGGGYTLAGGFWGGGAAAEPGRDAFVYLPVVFKN
jgi:hypothetical protein